MVDSFLRLIDSAYDLQREQGFRELFHQSYQYLRSYNKDRLELECGGVKAQFDTASRTSKDWFYPRYIDATLHEPLITKEIIGSLSSDSVFYDVGANIGYYTVFASEVCDEGEVHSFELDSSFIRLMERSLHLNGTSAVLNNNAISESSGEKVAYSGEFGKTSVDSSSNEPSQYVDSMTIDDYVVDHNKPDVMKIDVEGFELHALKGAKRSLQQGYPKKLFLEVHPPKIRDYGKDVLSALDLLESYGYSYTPIVEHRNKDANDRKIQKSEIKKANNVMLVCEL